MTDLSAYVDVLQVARELSIHPETVCRLLRLGTLPGVKVGTLWLIDKAKLARFKAAYNPQTGKIKGDTADESTSEPA